MDDKNFLDWEKKAPWLSYTKECKMCQCFGGWNLRVDAYRLKGDDTRENRLDRHFKAVCPNCYGRGYVDQNEKCEGHEWQWVRNAGRCLNIYKCANCGKHEEVDSGD
jgi:RecJ-like exonuclease